MVYCNFLANLLALFNLFAYICNQINNSTVASLTPYVETEY